MVFNASAARRPRQPLVVSASLLGLVLGCGGPLPGDEGPGTTSSGGTSTATATDTGTGSTESSTETGEACMEIVGEWTLARTHLPSLQDLWSEGDHFVAYGDGALLTYDGARLVWHEDLGFDKLASSMGVAARSLDEVWLSNNNNAMYWDGAVLESTIDGELDGVTIDLIRVADDGEVYLMGSSGCCAPQLWRWVDGGWDPLEGPALDYGLDFWPLADGELWLSAEDGWFAHFVDGAWEVEQHPDPSFDGEQIAVDAQGGLWAAKNMVTTRLVHRSAQGAWTEVMLEGAARRLLPDDDAVYAQVGVSDPAMFRWDGSSPPTKIFDATIHELGETGGQIRAVAGGPDRIYTLGLSPSIHTFVPVPPIALEPVLEFTSIFPWPAAAHDLDAVFERTPQTLRRFDEGQGAWVTVVELYEGPGAGVIKGFWPEGVDSGWLSVALDGDGGHELQRLEGGATEAWPQQPGLESLGQLWGSASDRVFVIGTSAGTGRVWRFDGAQWSELLGAQQGRGSIIGLTGDASSLVVITVDDEVLAWDGATWTELGAPLHEELESAALVRVGGEILARRAWLEGLDDPYLVEDIRRWDADELAWVPLESVPEPILGIADDGHGRAWALAGAPLRLFHHRGEGSVEQPWLEFELGDDTIAGSVEIVATEAGVLIHDERNTAVFRLGCAD
ncbi:hypothetical protein ENSA5_22810 [Enhygromyxa salina]|uniref:Uncharacterized protein n=1 Tax=Enhygromyxa salina TaxID=215803 RepID=A0A2S9YBI5_9BACT|nr:hypothetical protein [Enhygromyxa salina]PRQ02463.1 hypothetical protein ENSA5_22810 [Enhygromyxa salina]